MAGIESTFFDKKFNTSRYVLRYVVGASTDEGRHEVRQKINRLRTIADSEIAGVIDENFSNFNTSLVRFTTISNQLQETREKIEEVIDIINDIQYIEAAPSKIHTMLNKRDFLGAVDMFRVSSDLVFSDKLVAFHAITGVRNALMECKQTIEDRLVQELQHIIYLKDAFARFAKANQFSLASIEHELSKDSFLDNEFDKHILRSNLHNHDKSSFADSTSSFSSLTATNTLEAAVNAAKKLHREMEVIGTLKRTIEDELNDIVTEISLICRGIFNSSSYTSFENNFTEKKFGKHDHSPNFQTFLRLLFHVLRRIAQRHFLVSVYFNEKGESWNYDMQEVITKISGLLERVLGEYLEESTSIEPSITIKDTKLTASSGDLFKLSRHRPLNYVHGGRLHHPHDESNKTSEIVRSRVCEPSVFHLPVVYDDLEQIGKDLQQFFRSSNPSGVFAFLNQFIQQKWILKVKTKAQQFLALKYHNFASACRLPIPSDTSYQPPNIDSLLHIAEEICEMIENMPDHMLNLMDVLDSTVLKWLDECTAIVRDIREPTINHRQIMQSVSFSDLITLFHKYEGYQKAKKAVQITYQQAKIVPAREPIGKTSAQPPTPVLDNSKSPANLIMQKEFELESEFYSPDAWLKGTKGLLMDNSRIAMLAYINCACDYIAQYLQNIGTKNPTNSTLTRGSSFNQRTFRISPSVALQTTSWKCSALADECLLFLRREIRLHCFYYLTQLVSQRYDMAEDRVTMAQDSVLSLNINLSSIENALQPYLSSEKMALVFDGIDALLANILISNLKQMGGCTFSKGGVQQMLLNIGALHQGLTGTLYSYPRIGRTGYQFEHAKRYYQLLNLSETQLEVFLLENRKAYSPDAFKALWRVETPHRVLSKGSVNKLDSILR